jgi:tetratricopeptide (TPR) repeat protein
VVDSYETVGALGAAARIDETRYLAALGDADRSRLAAVNRDGLLALARYLESGRAVAFLGAGSSWPLYPLWDGVISELISAAYDGLGEDAARTCRALAHGHPDAVVEIVRRRLGVQRFREVLRQVFRPRRDRDSGRTWTPVQEMVTRCEFAGVVTTNYDPGIVNARMAVRPYAAGTGFASWTDDDALDQWRTGDVFGNDELPVLYAHGHHNQPDQIVLATTEYRRAYTGKVASVLKALIDSWHLVWIGFSFNDARIGAILREVSETSGSTADPGAAPRHVVLLPWDPAPGGASPHDMGVVRNLMEIQYGCRVVLYPAPDGDHSALVALLDGFTQARFPAAEPTWPSRVHRLDIPAGADTTSLLASRSGYAARWVHGGVQLEHFIGREEELARLDLWAADPEVRLIGVTAWGGAGKTSLVTEWASRLPQGRPVEGMFAWSFYEDASADKWANELLAWAEKVFGYSSGRVRRLSARVLDLAQRIPLVLVFDGLEVLQESPAGQGFGAFLDDLLRAVLTGMCQRSHGSMTVLTSRFPFADLEVFDGAAARMLDVPGFTPDEGAKLLDKTGGGWLPRRDRRNLVEAVDGHALAVSALASALADHPSASSMAVLRKDLAAAGRTDSRVRRILQFYADQLTVADRILVGVVSLFARPVPVAAVLAVGNSEMLSRPFCGWTADNVESAARGPLAGLLTWHPDGSVSAHPLVRDTFRPTALTGDTAQLASEIVLADLPTAPVASDADALRVVEMIELLLDAGQWEAAERLHYDFIDKGRMWARLPAARLGQRCAMAFIATDERRQACQERDHLTRFLNLAGLCAMLAGDMHAAEESLREAAQLYGQAGDRASQSRALERLSACLAYLGHAPDAVRTAEQAVEAASDQYPDILARNALAVLGAALDLTGNAAGAEKHFILADSIQTSHGSVDHLYSLAGVLWADLLLRTGRATAARALTQNNRLICARNHWNHNTARCDRLLARCDLTTGNLVAAGYLLDQATATFQDGDLLVELASTLPYMAEHKRQTGALTEAEQHCTEAIALAGPRELVPSHVQALATRAMIRADQSVDTGNPSKAERARDDADHALRLATKIRRLRWQELQALDAHAYIDHVTGEDRKWQLLANQRRMVLIPPDLDPNPLKR